MAQTLRVYLSETERADLQTRINKGIYRARVLTRARHTHLVNGAHAANFDPDDISKVRRSAVVAFVGKGWTVLRATKIPAFGKTVALASKAW